MKGEFVWKSYIVSMVAQEISTNANVKGTVSTFAVNAPLIPDFLLDVRTAVPKIKYD